MVDAEAILAARLADLDVRLRAVGLGDVADDLVLESEPQTVAQQTNTAFDVNLRGRINDAVRGNLIATATGASLDHLAVTLYGVQRLTLVEADPDANPPVLAVPEADADYRERAMLSFEARSSAGPQGGYEFFAKLPGVLDVRAYGEDDGALYANDDPVLAPEVLIVVLGRDGDGTPSSQLLADVAAALGPEEIRPCGDKVTVEPATVTTYDVVGVIKHAPGADPAPLLAAAEARVAGYVQARRKIGRLHQVLGIGAAMKVTDVEEIELTSPVADIDPGSKGAGYCASITLTAEIVEDDWR